MVECVHSGHHRGSDNVHPAARVAHGDEENPLVHRGDLPAGYFCLLHCQNVAFSFLLGLWIRILDLTEVGEVVMNYRPLLLLTWRCVVPRLFDEQLGVIESFQPIYSFEDSAEGQGE